MSGRSENIRFNVYLNDRQAGNTMGQLYKQSRSLRSELSKLKIGSQQWIAKMKEVQGVERNLQRVRGEIKNTNSFMGKMADGFNKYFGIITAGVAGITAAVYGMRKSMSVLADFEKTMANVMTLLSDSDKQKFGDILKKGSIDIIKEYGFTIEDTNKALFDAISAGVETGKSIEFLNESSILAIGGVTDLSVSVDGLTTVINAFKLESDDASDVSAAFFSAQKEGKTTVAELASGIGKAAPLAKSLGISYQELLSATAALTKGGISTDESFTYLRGTFTNLIKPTADLSKLFQKEFGHSINATEVKTRGFGTILEELNVLLEKYPNQLQSSIENVRALTAVTALSGKGFEDYQQILKKVQTDVGKNSSLAKAFSEQEDTLSQNLEKAKGNLIAMTISLMEGLRPAFISITSVVSKVSHAMLNFGLWMKENYDTVKAFAKALAIVATAMATYKAVVLAANAKVNIMIKLTGLMQSVALRASIAYNKLTGNIGRAAAAQRVLNTTVKANPLGLILGLLASAGAAYLSFRDQVAEATDEQKRLNEELERQQEILMEKSNIDDKSKLVDNMTAGQLRKYKIELNDQLQALEEINEKKLLASEKYKKEVALLNSKYANESASTKEALFANKYVTEARDKALEELNRLHLLEQNLNGDRLKELQQIVDKKLEAFSGADDGGGTGSGDISDDEIKKIESLNQQIAELARAQQLDKMEKHQREIAQVEDKYAKLIEEAKGFNDQIKRLDELKSADLKTLQVKHDKEKRESEINARIKINEELGNLATADLERQRGILDEKLRMAEENGESTTELSENLANIEKEIRDNAYFDEIEQSSAMFEQLRQLAEQHGLDIEAITKAELDYKKAAADEYMSHEVQVTSKGLAQIKKNRIAAATGAIGVTQNLVGSIGALMGEEAENSKELAIMQITLSTAMAAINAYASASQTPLIGYILGPIAAAAAIIYGMAQLSKVKSTTAPSYGRGGVSGNKSKNTAGIASGASHSQGGISMIDSASGEKVGEMEGGEPYMILSKETYKNNRELVDSLLDSSMNRGGEPVEWMQPGYYPHPDVSSTVNNLRTSKFASGTVTNVNNVYQNAPGTAATGSNAEMVGLMRELLAAFNKFKYVKAILDLDGTLELKEALADMETLESNAGV